MRESDEVTVTVVGDSCFGDVDPILARQAKRLADWAGVRLLAVRFEGPESDAAGIDVGAREMFVAVPPGRDENPVRVFATFTEDLERLADWLLQCGLTTVALESTGVYWIPLYGILEQ